MNRAGNPKRMYRCYASCAFGIESILSGELKSLGMENILTEDARVYFDASAKEIAYANLFLRTADRVYFVLKEFTAKTFEELFEGVAAIDFADILPSDARFPVNANAVKSTLMSVPSIQSISKKAVVRSLQRVYSSEFFPENGNLFNIYVNIHKDKVTVALNTSGVGLNRRGYRLKNAQAPIRETLAAAMILISRWNRRDFYDPMCGSGTIAIEAAMLAANMAPGVKRRFDAMGYSNEFKKAFAEAREDALSRIRKPEMEIFASDIDEKSLALAKEHARNMDVSEYINFSRQDVRRFSQPQNPAAIITNPPYAKRLGDAAEVSKLYAGMGKAFLSSDDMVVFVLSANDDFERYYGARADKKRKLYNGSLRCTYYQYFKKK